MNEPTISVVFPVYNCQKYLESSLNSILSQTFADFEVIVIDDGSTDDSLNIIKRMQCGDSRIKVISRENKGLVYTLNEGVEKASGAYIARMDADDIAHSKRFKIQLEAIEREQADICGSAINYIDEHGGRIGSGLSYPVKDFDIKRAFMFGCAIAHPSVLIRKEIFKKERYSENALHSEDYDLWIRLAKLGCVFYNCKNALLEYRVHDSQVSVAFKKDQIDYSVSLISSYVEWYLNTYFDISVTVNSGTVLKYQYFIISKNKKRIREDVRRYIYSFLPYKKNTLLDLWYVFKFSYLCHIFSFSGIAKLALSKLFGREIYNELVLFLRKACQ